MIRMQIYLTKSERQKLSILAEETEKSQSELIRLAIDQFIENTSLHKNNKSKFLSAAKGMWSNRKDLPDFSATRKEFDRNSKD